MPLDIANLRRVFIHLFILWEYDVTLGIRNHLLNDACQLETTQSKGVF